MAGMFYSLKETAEILGKTQDEVRQLAEQGKLRVFRDGSNLLFKIDEVHALQAESAVAPDLDLEVSDLELDEAVAAEPLGESLEQEQSGPTLDDSLEQDIFKLDEELAAVEPATEDEALAGLELPAAGEDETPAGLEVPASAEEDMASELGLAAEEARAELDLTAQEADASSEPALTADSGEPEALAPSGEEDIFLLDEEPSAGGSTTGTEEEISLASESDLPAAESDITNMDTALTGEGVNVLGESSSGYDVTDDSMAETAGPTGTSAEASLEEIEEDVNLDSFGSGSGLLDLSLQADDTSLGGILDEIYTSEGGEEERIAGVEDQASFEAITAEADHAVPDEVALPESVAVLPVATGAVYAEAVPDTQSNVLGMLLFLPLLALLYTAIVTVAGLANVMPSILASVQGLIWYILGGAVMLSLGVVGVSFVAGGEKAPKAVREKKAGVGKGKKDKRVKAEKPAKEKKSFFGKKK